MTPSPRSHPNHPQQPVSPPYTRFVRGNGYGSGHWLRHLLAGSPLLQTESGSLSFGTTCLPRAAPHPVSRRRSCLRLLSRCSSRDDSDFHWLISYMCVRTSGVSMSARGSSDSAVIDSRYKPAWQRKCLSRSRRLCSPLSRSGALFAEDSPCWFCSCSFVLFVVQIRILELGIGRTRVLADTDHRYKAPLCERVLKPRPAHPARQRRNSAAKAGGQEGLMRVARRAL
jgi:hypothetical protein